MLILLWLTPIARIIVVAALAYAIIVWATYWAVRNQKMQPFGFWPRFVRTISDPVVTSVEKRVLRAGGNPQDAPLWLLGGVVVIGLVALSFIGWLIETIAGMIAVSQLGGNLWMVQIVSAIFSILQIALFIRVLSSWFSVSPYNPFMRIVYGLTDWLIDPIRKLLPNFGMIDFSPMVAYLALTIARGALMRVLM